MLTISEAKKIPGFIQAVVVEDPTNTVTGWVVAVAKNYPKAMKAANALKVSYDKGPNANVSSELILTETKRLQSQPGGEIYFTNGDAAQAISKAAKVLDAEYTTNINIHCPLESMNAVAEFKDGKLHLYAGNQFLISIDGDRRQRGWDEARRCSDTPVLDRWWLRPQAGLRHDHPAGCRRESGPQAGQGHLTRRHDMLMDFTRPLVYQKISAGLDDSGKIIGMNHDLVSAWLPKRWASGFP